MSRGYRIVNLDLLIEEVGEERVDEILKTFSCPLNFDVEEFLHRKAIAFSKSGIAKTHLVFASYKNKHEIAGYFSLAGSKSFVVSAKSKAISRKIRERIRRFATYDNKLKQYNIPAPLIGQLGKNANSPNLISGSELLQLACDKIKQVQLDVGGKFAYLECENVPKLVEFYQKNGFVLFGERELDADEKNLKTHTLLQLLKYL